MEILQNAAKLVAEWGWSYCAPMMLVKQRHVHVHFLYFLVVKQQQQLALVDVANS